MDTYTFPDCGCAWPVLGPPPAPGLLPLMRVDRRNPPFCSRVADLFARGLTKGCWQLENNLGQTWAHRLAPADEEMVSALVALLRPGTLQSKDQNGVSMTEHFVHRRHGREEVPEVHPVVDRVLADTIGICLYQESALALVRDTAGFSLAEADLLRRAASKKDAAKMEEVGRLYIERAEQHGVITRELAERLFEIIKASNRYAFNKAHSFAYARRCIKTAYIKAHFPVMFFGDWLKYAHLKSEAEDERAELVEDAKQFGVTVHAPDFRRLRRRISTDGVALWFGTADCKGVGATNSRKLFARAAELEAAWGLPLAAWAWEDVLFHLSDAAPSNAFGALVEVGAFGFTGVPRARQLTEYKLWLRLTDTEAEWARLADRHAAGRLDPAALEAEAAPLREELAPLETRLKALRKAAKAAPGDETAAAALADAEPRVRELRDAIRPLDRAIEVAATPRPPRGLAAAVRAAVELGRPKAARVEELLAEADLLDNPPAPEEDTPQSVADAEVKHLGVPLTATRLGARDTSRATLRCADFAADRRAGAFAVELRDVRKLVTKKDGRPFCCLTVADDSGVMADVVVWPDQWVSYRALLREKNTVLLVGTPDRRGEGFVVDRVEQL